jgi:hypothetical protein
VLPAVALLSGRQVTAELQCHAACHGTASLRLNQASSTAKLTRAPLAHGSFQITGTSPTAIHVTLSASGAAALARYPRVAVQLTLVVSAGRARPITLVSTLELTRKLLAPAHKSTRASVSTSRAA